MSDYTIPEGEVITNATYSSYHGWKAFDHDDTFNNGCYVPNGTDPYVGYRFELPVKARVIKVIAYTGKNWDPTISGKENIPRYIKYKVQASNDANSWDDIVPLTNYDTELKKETFHYLFHKLDLNKKYLYYRFLYQDVYGSGMGFNSNFDIVEMYIF